MWAEGDTATYTMRLATRPTGSVTVAVSSGDTGAVAVPASFVFTASNWDRARPVTVRGVDDGDTSDETVAVTHTASGGGYGSVTGSVTVTVDDDDTVPPGLEFSPRQVDVGEGDTATYTMRLATRPTGAVTVAVSSGDTGAVSVPVSFVFTTGNWDQRRTVTVRGVEDGDTSDETVAVTHSASGGGYGGVSGTVTVTVDDDDTVPPALVLSPRRVSVGEGDNRDVPAESGDAAHRGGHGHAVVWRHRRGVGAGELRVHDRQLGPGAHGDGARCRGRRHVR